MTSSSRARSLIRTLLIRPFCAFPACLAAHISLIARRNRCSLYVLSSELAASLRLRPVKTQRHAAAAASHGSCLVRVDPLVGDLLRPDLPARRPIRCEVQSALRAKLRRPSNAVAHQLRISPRQSSSASEPATSSAPSPFNSCIRRQNSAGVLGQIRSASSSFPTSVPSSARSLSPTPVLGALRILSVRPISALPGASPSRSGLIAFGGFLRLALRPLRTGRSSAAPQRRDLLNASSRRCPESPPAAPASYPPAPPPS